MIPLGVTFWESQQAVEWHQIRSAQFKQAVVTPNRINYGLLYTGQAGVTLRALAVKPSTTESEPVYSYIGRNQCAGTIGPNYAQGSDYAAGATNGHSFADQLR